MTEPLQVANVDRSLSVLETLSAAPAGLSLSALAQRIGLAKSAAHRLLQTLAVRGYVYQDPRSQHYCLSLKLALLGFRYLDARRLPDLVQGALDRLAQETGEYCRIAIVEGDGLAWIARAQGARMGLRYDPPMGREVVLHATATGKAWLATLAEDQALRIVLARGFETPDGFGRRAVRSVSELRRHLAETRRRGFAVAMEEGEPGIVALAAVFRAYDLADAPVAGTVSIAGPLTRMGAARIEALAPLLKRTATELGTLWPLHQRQLGGSQTPQVAA
ncbi:MAG TPA: IclR family transcriptional regulator [Casimicrobiaceae bacterium]|nr:IclR family transcriptional regulator [Casimicrobiaceae bacterium]